MSTSPVLVSRSELADALSLSRKQIDRYRQDGTFPLAMSTPIRFDLEECRAAYAARKRKSEESRAASPSKLKAQIRMARAALEESALKLLRLRDEILPAADVEEYWTENRRACLERIWRLPDEVATKLSGVDDVATVSAILEQSVRQVLTDLAAIDPTEAQAHD